MIRLVTTSIAEDVANFAADASSELLVATPWLTDGAVSLLLHSVPQNTNILFQVLARFEVQDFVAGTSDLAAVHPFRYGSHIEFHARAFPALHAKFIVKDRRELLLGSANLTESGMRRNFEAAIITDEAAIVQAAATAFDDWWGKATPLALSYFQQIEAELLTLAAAETDQARPSERGPRSGPVLTLRRETTPHARMARSLIQQAHEGRPSKVTPRTESLEEAIRWVRSSRFVQKERRGAEEFIRRLESYIYDPDVHLRASAIDVVGRSQVMSLGHHLRRFLATGTEPEQVRAASAFALALLADISAVPALLDALDTDDHAGRWARRACFMFLSRVAPDERAIILDRFAIPQNAAVLDYIERLAPDRGTVSERLTKALILEQRLTGAWGDVELDLLRGRMFEISGVLGREREKDYVNAVKRAAEDLRTAPGDLRHGPLSPSLLRRLSSPADVDPALRRAMKLD